jgi:hypothetical protein
VPFRSPRTGWSVASGALMKWFSIIPLCVLAVLATACEKHPASALPPAHGAGDHHGEAKGDHGHTAKPAEHAEAPKQEAAKPAADAKPGEAPKFFPDGKAESK